tara:strand:+ start:224 stop:1096 length:873 start_codon:yes stop_codon:yes gene_type:complete
MEGKKKVQEIKSMPGVYKYSIDKLHLVMDKVKKLKIPAVALFPNIPSKKKDINGSESLNENNLICNTIRFLKKNYKNIGVITDVALDPYTSHGHDGIFFNGKIDNDKTIEILKKQALLQAKAGSDIIAPSDMMDGRIGLIRKYLDKNGYIETQLLSYAVKYSSNFYGPFRDAVGTKSILKGNKKTYQMDFKNSKESLSEVALDIKEGADFIIVKPGLPYLDIICQLKKNFNIPIFGYQVSGEYSMIKTAIKNKILDKESIFESLISLKRAGCNAIITYFAIDIAKQILKN